MSSGGDGGGFDLLGRVERLEREVEGLKVELREALEERDVREGERGIERSGGRDFSGTTASERGARRGLRVPWDLGGFDELRRGEWWLNKVGIGLLLFGVAFLFIYSVERGWIGPWTRVGVGLGIGVSLLAVGLRVYGERRAFGQVLLGGGVGALYITGFAAFQLYSLLPYPLAFAYMVAVTLAAFALSLRGDGVALSLIGALGGLGTPFLLYEESGTLAGLVLYTCVILTGMVAVYYRKGWGPLLALSFVGGWLVFLVGYADVFLTVAGPSVGDRRVLQGGVACAWLLFSIVPAARELRRETPSAATHALVVSTPLVAFGFCALIWELPASDLGWISLSAAALYALVALALRGAASRSLSYTHALVALVFATLAAVLMLRGETLLVVLAAEASALHYLSRTLSDRLLGAQAHALFFAAGVWLALRLLVDAPASTGPALFGVGALVDLLVIGLGFGASFLVAPRSVETLYRVAAHAGVLAWLWRELSALPGGEAYVTVAWGVYAVALLVAGLRLDLTPLVRGGMATLFLVVGKLFLVDLAEVDALWRVLLFLGFGVVFLALSYYSRALWRPGGRSEPPAGRGGSGA